MDKVFKILRRAALGAGLIFIVGGLLWVAPVSSEPSADEMRAAVEAQFENVNAAAQEASESCARGQGAEDPLLAMQCLSYAVMGGKNGPQFTLTGFEKKACEKAQEAPGYICTYTMLYEIPMSGMMYGLDRLIQEGTESSGRFFKHENRWVRLPE